MRSTATAGMDSSEDAKEVGDKITDGHQDKPENNGTDRPNDFNDRKKTVDLPCSRIFKPTMTFKQQ